MRREITAFPSLDDDSGAIKWRREFKAICKAQHIEFMLNRDYDPDVDTKNLGMKYKFKIAQAHLYAVLLKSVHTLMGKSFVIKNKDELRSSITTLVGLAMHVWPPINCPLQSMITTFLCSPDASRRTRSAYVSSWT